MPVVSLRERHGEMRGIVCQFSEYFRVVLEDHHLEVEYRDEDRKRSVEELSHCLQLAPDIFSDEIPEGLLFLAVALRNFAVDAVLLLQAGQDDILLLLVHLAYQLAQSLQV